MFLAFGVTEYVLLALALISFICLLVVFFLYLRKKLLQRFALLRYFYPIIRKTAVYYDFYLINQLEISVGLNDSIFIDHLIFGDKYIYLVSDFVFKGTLSGKSQDSKWILRTKKGEEIMIDSPVYKNRELVQRLSLRTALDQTTFIAVTLVSKDTKITDLEVNDPQNYIIDTRDFMKLILKIESRNIRPLNSEELKKRVHEIDALNLRRNRGRKWPKKM
ncbi:MAG: hypothetical protein WC275_01585 [Bacilli bacterium]